MGNRKGLTRGALHEAARERLARRKGNGVHHHIQYAPALLKRCEGSIDLGIVRHIER